MKRCTLFMRNINKLESKSSASTSQSIAGGTHE
jgi:hypothetical protein